MKNEPLVCQNIQRKKNVPREKVLNMENLLRLKVPRWKSYQQEKSRTEILLGGKYSKKE
jgi:hypothetical protein